MVLSFFLALPLLLGFIAPNVVLFLQAEGIRPLLAAIGLWLVLAPTAFFALTWLAYSERPKAERPRPPLGIILPLVAAAATLALFVASARGMNLAKQAADGNQIVGKRFGLLSVRANVVCLNPVEKAPRLNWDAVHISSSASRGEVSSSTTFLPTTRSFCAAIVPDARACGFDRRSHP
jgi:hypothetical protein